MIVIIKRNISAITIAVGNILVVAMVFSVFFIIYSDFKSETNASRMLNIGIDIAMVFSAAIFCILCNFDKTNKGKTGKIFKLLVFLVFFDIYLDLIYLFIDRNPDFIYFNHFVNYAYYSSNALISMVFCNYLYSLVEKPQRFLKIHLSVVSIGFVADLMLIYSNVLTHQIFAVGADGVYSREPLYFLTVLYPFLTVTSSIVITLILKISVKEKLSLIAYCALPYVSMLVQSEHFTFIQAALFLSLLILYSNIHLERGRQIVQQKVELAEQKMNIAMSQIQPHFLYNTLNSIYYLCDKNPKLAKKTISDFSDYLRMNINSIKSKNNISFNSELKHIKTYLEIEQLRFGERLNVEFDIKTTAFTVPALSIQPIVENAVKHGVCKRVEGGTVKLSTYEDSDYSYIVVEDDGVGFDTSIKFDSTHVGISNVCERIKSSSNGEVTYSSEIGKGTKVVVQLPKIIVEQ